MKKILIFSTLKSQVNYTDNFNITQTEPIHPYIGFLWSKIIEDSNNIVHYLNTTSYKKNVNFNFFYKYISLPRNYTTVIVHSTSGLGKASLIKIFNWRINVVYYSLSKINPRGNYIKLILRNIFYFTDILLSDHIIYGLNNLMRIVPLKWFSMKSTYFPFLTDYNYFQSAINASSRLKIEYDDYILIVGDITRDDEFVYKELSSFNYPIVRITRDPKVVKIVEKIYNKTRGDVILSGVSFLELANYYCNARCCIVASKYDDWQPGGITSIAEAMACNGICICNSGGEIESEFNFLAAENNMNSPLLYFNYPIKDSLRSLISNFNNLSNSQLQTMRLNSNNFSSKVLNFNIKGIQLLNDILIKNIK